MGERKKRFCPSRMPRGPSATRKVRVHGKTYEDNTGDPEEQPKEYSDEDIDEQFLAGPVTVQT